jgi:hypothetical protein
MATSPWRPAAFGFGATRNSTWPSPWPDAGDRPEIQLASVDAVQAHSRSVAMKIVLDAPLASSTLDGPVKVTRHLSGEGLVDVVAVDPQPAVAIAIATAPMTVGIEQRQFVVDEYAIGVIWRQSTTRAEFAKSAPLGRIV